MGLFDGLKMMGDIVKGGIAAVKASGKLKELVQRSQSEYKSLINPEEAKLYQAYMELKHAQRRYQGRFYACLRLFTRIFRISGLAREAFLC